MFGLHSPVINPLKKGMNTEAVLERLQAPIHKRYSVDLNGVDKTTALLEAMLDSKLKVA
jgi:hypothetical protein